MSIHESASRNLPTNKVLDPDGKVLFIVNEKAIEELQVLSLPISYPLLNLCMYLYGIGSSTKSATAIDPIHDPWPAHLGVIERVVVKEAPVPQHLCRVAGIDPMLASEISIVIRKGIYDPKAKHVIQPPTLVGCIYNHTSVNDCSYRSPSIHVIVEPLDPATFHNTIALEGNPLTLTLTTKVKVEGIRRSSKDYPIAITISKDQRARDGGISKGTQHDARRYRTS